MISRMQCRLQTKYVRSYFTQTYWLVPFMGQSSSAAAADGMASGGELGVLGGSEEAHLVGVREHAYPLTPQCAPSGARPAFDGTISEFAESVQPQIAEQMWNRARVCPECGKACAVTMRVCNACGSHALAAAPEARTPNVICGFIVSLTMTVRRGVLHCLRPALSLT